MWALRYDTLDFPGKYVARLFENEKPQDVAISSNSLEALRKWFDQIGLVAVAPMPGDEENLIEVWL